MEPIADHKPQNPCVRIVPTPRPLLDCPLLDAFQLQTVLRDVNISEEPRCGDITRCTLRLEEMGGGREGGQRIGEGCNARACPNVDTPIGEGCNESGDGCNEVERGM